MGSPFTRILLVEDSKAYRSHIIALLSKNPILKVVSEAGDGAEAVAQAQNLKPDIILMDIGLPTVNGLDAARQISGLAPLARIVFLTQRTDVDVVREAFTVGAWGYVHKQNAASELLVAVASVSRGERFVSDGLGKDGFKAGRTYMPNQKPR